MKNIIILLLLILPFISCQKEDMKISVNLPETSVISSNSRWGVVKYPYIRVRKSPNINDVISSAFRQGDIVKILKSSEFIVTNKGEDLLWFYSVLDDVEGWVVSDDLSIYDSREQALTASKMFK